MLFGQALNFLDMHGASACVYTIFISGLVTVRLKLSSHFDSVFDRMKETVTVAVAGAGWQVRGSVVVLTGQRTLGPRLTVYKPDGGNQEKAKWFFPLHIKTTSGSFLYLAMGKLFPPSSSAAPSFLNVPAYWM